MTSRSGRWAVTVAAINDNTSLNNSQSDFSEASLMSFGRSLQTDEHSEASHLLGDNVQTVQPQASPGIMRWRKTFTSLHEQQNNIFVVFLSDLS